MAQGEKGSSGGNLGFEAELFKTADKLRGNMEPTDYRHVALGLIFLKHISDTFEARHAQLLAEDAAAAEDKDEYLADNIFWVPKDARWTHLRANAKQSNIGTLIDDAMRAIEKDNESFKGVLPKDYARPALNKVMLGELIDLISGVTLHERGEKSRDVLGRVYEYFLGQFAGPEGKRGGEFYTPRSVVRTLVEMLEPYTGRVYDPCCVLRPKPPLPFFFGYLLARRTDFRAYAIRAMGGTTGHQRVENGQLRNFKLPVPDRDTATAFASFVQPLQKSIFENVARMSTLATLRDTLLPRLISGALRVMRDGAISAEPVT